MFKNHERREEVSTKAKGRWENSLSWCHVVCDSSVLTKFHAAKKKEWITSSLTYLPFPPWCPSGKQQSQQLLVSSVRSSSCVSGCEWKCTARGCPGQLTGPEPVALRSDWTELHCTEPRSQSGNNTLHSAQASPSPLSPPDLECVRKKHLSFFRVIVKMAETIYQPKIKRIILCDHEKNCCCSVQRKAKLVVSYVVLFFTVWGGTLSIVNRMSTLWHTSRRGR